jgi:hypothetical protein
MLNYLLGYGAFLLGATLYMLSKVQDYKSTAKANPNPNVSFSVKGMLSDESINIARLLLGGVALVIFLPMLIGGATVDVKNTTGAVITSLTLKAVLIPMYFILGYSGNSAVFALFGKYKKTLLEQVGVNETDKP